MLLGACAGSGSAGSLAPASPIASQAPALPSATASEATSGGGGRGGANYDDSGAAATAASPAPGPQAHQVNLGTSPLGEFLTGDGGRSLYTFKPDGANTSTCVAGCVQAWPPFTIGTGDALKAGDGVTGALTTFAREDGSLQVAYNGAPLYYFANDTTAGDTNGQGIGGAWFVAKP